MQQNETTAKVRLRKHTVMLHEGTALPHAGIDTVDEQTRMGECEDTRGEGARADLTD